MAKKKKPSPHGALVAAAKVVTAAHQDDEAERRTLERNDSGKFVAKVAPEEWEWALEQVRSGNTDANISRHLGIAKGTIAVKRRQDPDFAAAYLDALEDAFLTIAQETRAVARGEEGYSSGDVTRDRLIVETDLKLASKLSKKLFGDKAMIEAGSFTVVVKPDTDDLV
jgi:hypothetical protein